jgi:hypothetical protein
MSAAKMQSMAKRGLLPKKLAKCQIPTCTSCLYGKTTRRPWRTKPKVGQQGGKLRTGSEPAKCISINQLESNTPGLIAQIKGWLTKNRYKVATILLITSVVCPTSTFRSQQMQMKLLKQSWLLRDLLPKSRSKSRVIKLTMAGLQRTSSWQLSRNQVKQSLSAVLMLIFRMLLQKEGSGLCKTKQEPC